MKKISLLIIIASCTCLLLSSCSRQGNITITKRHYRGGYYVDLSTGKQNLKQHTSSKSETADVTPSAPALNAAEDNIIVSPAIEIPQTAPAFVAAQPEKKKYAHKDATGSLYASTQNISAIREEVKAENLNYRINSLPDATSVSSSSSSGTPYWLMIVFCIILPPLAVGLKFGIVDKFWISILLTLLFWLPGVIYALIVVTQK